MAEDEDEPVMNKYYALVKVVRGKEGNRYEFITSRCGYEVYTEDQVKSMLSIIDMGGIQMGADGSLVIHKAVDVEGASGDQNKPGWLQGEGRGQVTTSFLIEIGVTGFVILLYLFYQYIKVLRELVELLREELEKED